MPMPHRPRLDALPCLAHDETRSITIPYEIWLAQPDKREIPWRIEFLPAAATFDQRVIMPLVVSLNVGKLLRDVPERDLHLLIKAGDSNGWYDDEDYTHQVFTGETARKTTMDLAISMYLRPGRHLIGIILYDAQHKQRSVTRRWITVPARKHDPAPELDRDLPAVEFVRSRDDAALSPRKPWQQGTAPCRGATARQSADPSPGAYGQYMMRSDPPERPLALRTAAPLEIDLLADFTPSSQAEGSGRAYSLMESAIWEMSQVVVQMRPRRGCLRITGVDVLGQQVLLERQDIRTLDWRKLADRIGAINPLLVDVKDLQARTRMAQFFQRQVEQMLDRRTGFCDRSAPGERAALGHGGAPHEDPQPTPASEAGSPAQHVYIVIAAGFSFPEGTRRQEVETGIDSASRLYYLQVGNPWDEMSRIVKPLRPHRFMINSPQDFRRALAGIINDLGGLDDAPLIQGLALD